MSDENKVKLTPKQKDIIGKMRNGWVLHWLSGLTPSAFMSSHKQPNITIRTDTVFKLKDLGLIISNNERHVKYTLTDLGKTITI